MFLLHCFLVTSSKHMLHTTCVFSSCRCVCVCIKHSIVLAYILQWEKRKCCLYYYTTPITLLITACTRPFIVIALTHTHILQNPKHKRPTKLSTSANGVFPLQEPFQEPGNLGHVFTFWSLNESFTVPH